MTLCTAQSDKVKKLRIWGQSPQYGEMLFFFKTNHWKLLT